MSMQVHRLSQSSYLGSDFQAREKTILEEIPSISYVTSSHEIDYQENVILLTNTHVDFKKIDSQLLSRTRLLIHANSGHDNIPASFIQDHHFPIVLGNDIRSHAVSEYVLACLFSAYTSIPFQKSWDRQRIWNRKLLKDSSVLIVGYGHIGKILFAALDPLCRRLKVCDPQIVKVDERHLLKLSDKFFKDLDVLIMACNLNDESRGMIDTPQLSLMAKDCVIINSARGALVNEKALLDFLLDHPRATAYLDVFESEPRKLEDFEHLRNLHTSSHIAGVYASIKEQTCLFEKSVIEDFLEGEASFKLKHKDHIL